MESTPTLPPETPQPAVSPSPEVPSASAPAALAAGVSPAEEPSNIVEAAHRFREVIKLPNYSEEDLLKMGCTATVSPEGTKLVTIPCGAQRTMVAATKDFGFGAAQAVETLLQRALMTLGLEGDIKFDTDKTSYAFNAWTTVPKDATAPSNSPLVSDPPLENEVDATEAVIAERGKVYGDPELSHENIGLNWTGMIQQHYQVRLPYPMPAWLVELMMAGFKIHRSARVFHEDNYVDLEAYALRFARNHQRAAFAPKEAK